MVSRRVRGELHALDGAVQRVDQDLAESKGYILGVMALLEFLRLSGDVHCVTIPAGPPGVFSAAPEVDLQARRDRLALLERLPRGAGRDFDRDYVVLRDHQFHDDPLDQGLLIRS